MVFLGGFDSSTVDATGSDVEVRLKLAAVSDTVTVSALSPRSADMARYDIRPLDILRTLGATRPSTPDTLV